MTSQMTASTNHSTSEIGCLKFYASEKDEPAQTQTLFYEHEDGGLLQDKVHGMFGGNFDFAPRDKWQVHERMFKDMVLYGTLYGKRFLALQDKNPEKTRRVADHKVSDITGEKIDASDVFVVLTRTGVEKPQCMFSQQFAINSCTPQLAGMGVNFHETTLEAASAIYAYMSDFFYPYKRAQYAHPETVSPKLLALEPYKDKVLAHGFPVKRTQSDKAATDLLYPGAQWTLPVQQRMKEQTIRKLELIQKHIRKNAPAWVDEREDVFVDDADGNPVAIVTTNYMWHMHVWPANLGELVERYNFMPSPNLLAMLDDAYTASTRSGQLLKAWQQKQREEETESRASREQAVKQEPQPRVNRRRAAQRLRRDKHQIQRLQKDVTETLGDIQL